MLVWAVKDQTSPVAIRYPRGGDRDYSMSDWTDMGLAKAVKCHRQGSRLTILTYGTMLQNAMKAADVLSKYGIEATVLRVMSLAPLPIDEIAANLSTDHLLILEEAAAGSAVCHSLAEAFYEKKPNVQIHSLNLGDGFVTHGSLSALYEHHGLDGYSVAEFVRKEHFYESEKTVGCAPD